jgi:hypothetical protein
MESKEAAAALDEFQPLADEYHDDEPLCEHHEKWHEKSSLTKVLSWMYWVTIHITIGVLLFALNLATSENEALSDKCNNNPSRNSGISWCECSLLLLSVSTFLTDTTAPAMNAVQYEVNGEHALNHEVYSPYSGPPTPEQDQAWTSLIERMSYLPRLEKWNG